MIAKLLEYGQLRITDPRDTGETVFSVAETATIREALGIPDVSAEELAWLEAERELQKAQDDGIILWWSPEKLFNSDWRYRIQYTSRHSGIRTEWQPPEYSYTSRLAAVQAAVEHVRTLRKPVLPKPEEMSIPVRLAELGKLGYALKPCPSRPSDTIALYRGDAYCAFGMPYTWGEDRLTVEFLREARRLDGDA